MKLKKKFFYRQKKFHKSAFILERRADKGLKKKSST